MSVNKKAKIITLVLTIVVLAGIAAGVYFITGQLQNMPSKLFAKSDTPPSVSDADGFSEKNVRKT